MSRSIRLYTYYIFVQGFSNTLDDKSTNNLTLTPFFFFFFFFCVCVCVCFQSSSSIVVDVVDGLKECRY